MTMKGDLDPWYQRSSTMSHRLFNASRVKLYVNILFSDSIDLQIQIFKLKVPTLKNLN